MSLSINGCGDAATFKNRAESLTCVDSCNAGNMASLVGMIYGSWGPNNVVYNSVNYQAGGNYVNDNQYTTAIDDESDVLYKEDGANSFLEWDQKTGDLTVKNAKEVAKECGLTTEQGESVVNTVVLGKGILGAKTYQYMQDATFDYESFNLNQSAFNSKWVGLWTRYNLDWDRATDSPDNQEDYNVTALSYEAMYENEQILTEEEYEQIAQCTTDTDKYNLFLQFLKLHSFNIQVI